MRRAHGRASTRGRGRKGGRARDGDGNGKVSFIRFGGGGGIDNGNRSRGGERRLVAEGCIVRGQGPAPTGFQCSTGARQSYRVGSTPRSDGSAHGRPADVQRGKFYLRMSESRDRRAVAAWWTGRGECGGWGAARESGGVMVDRSMPRSVKCWHAMQNLAQGCHPAWPWP